MCKKVQSLLLESLNTEKFGFIVRTNCKDVNESDFEDILKENEILATFFLQGQCLAGNEEIVRRMHAEGHLIGNHTFHHVQLTKVSEEEAREEVVKTSNAIYEITEEYPVYIRPPFGEWRPCSDDDPGTLGCGFPRLGEPEHRVDLQRGASECEGWQHYSHA